MYEPIIAHVFHAHALRIHLLHGKTPTSIQSAYTTPWYDRMPPLPITSLRKQPTLADRDWSITSQETISPSEDARLDTHKRPKARKRERCINLQNPAPHTIGPTQYPTTPRTPVHSRFRYIDESTIPDTPFQRPHRTRTSRITQEQIQKAVHDKNVDLLNAVAHSRKLPGYQSFRIAVDQSGRGLCLLAAHDINPTDPHATHGFCEYSGTEREVPANEHIGSVPLKQLMYGCEYVRAGVRYRKSPDRDLQSLLRYMQAPNPGEEPTCRLMAGRDTKTETRISLFINHKIRTNEALTIDYGGPYWQIFWPHLSIAQQQLTKHQYPDLTFPPHWPPNIPPGYHNHSTCSSLENDYSLAARNIYDTLLTLDDAGDTSDIEETWEPPSPDTPTTHTLPPPHTTQDTNGHTTSQEQTHPLSPITTATPIRSRDIMSILHSHPRHMTEWVCQQFRIHCDVGIEIGKSVIHRIAKATNQPTPAFPSVKEIKEIMMRTFWQINDTPQVRSGACGIHLQRCMQDIEEELGNLTEADMKAQINIRMTKTTHQDPPPHYPIASCRLIQGIIRGLEHKYGLKGPRITALTTQLTTYQIPEDCECIIEIHPDTTTIMLWTRRGMSNINPTQPTPSYLFPLRNQTHVTAHTQPYQKHPQRKRAAFRENDKPP